MKYVAIALLVANVAYFVWQGYFAAREPAPEVSPPRRDAAVASLTLLSEQPRSTVSGSRKPLDVAADAGPLEAEESAAREEQVREATLTEAINNPVAAEPRGPIGCPAIGPFTDVFQAESILEQVRALDLPAELRAIDEKLLSNEFRVLIPPAASVEEAFRKLRELQSLDIDSYILGRGDQAMGISLGVFSRREAAEAMREERRRQGYQAEITEIPRFERQFWIVGRRAAAAGTRLDVWARFAEADAEVTLDTLSCPESDE